MNQYGPTFVYDGPYEFSEGLTAQSNEIKFEGFSHLWLQQEGVGRGLWHGRNGALDPTIEGVACARFSVLSVGTNGLWRADYVITDFEKYWLLTDSIDSRPKLSKVDLKLFGRIARRTLE
jgi:hypothetical protein